MEPKRGHTGQRDDADVEKSGSGSRPPKQTHFPGLKCAASQRFERGHYPTSVQFNRPCLGLGFRVLGSSKREYPTSYNMLQLPDSWTLERTAYLHFKVIPKEGCTRRTWRQLSSLSTPLHSSRWRTARPNYGANNPHPERQLFLSSRHSPLALPLKELSLGSSFDLCGYIIPPLPNRKQHAMN